MRRDIGRIMFGSFSRDSKQGITVLVDRKTGRDVVPITIWDGHKMNLIEMTKFISDKVVRAKNK